MQELRRCIVWIEVEVRVTNTEAPFEVKVIKTEAPFISGPTDALHFFSVKQSLKQGIKQLVQMR